MIVQLTSILYYFKCELFNNLFQNDTKVTENKYNKLGQRQASAWKQGGRRKKEGRRRRIKKNYDFKPSLVSRSKNLAFNICFRNIIKKNIPKFVIFKVHTPTDWRPSITGSSVSELFLTHFLLAVKSHVTIFWLLTLLTQI